MRRVKSSKQVESRTLRLLRDDVGRLASWRRKSDLLPLRKGILQRSDKLPSKDGGIRVSDLNVYASAFPWWVLVRYEIGREYITDILMREGSQPPS